MFRSYGPLAWNELVTGGTKNTKDCMEQISMTSQICFFKLLPVHARAASSKGDTVLRWREIWLYQIKSNWSRFIRQQWGQVDNQQPNYEPNYLRKWSLRAYLMSMSQISLMFVALKNLDRSVKTSFHKRLQMKISHLSSNSWNRAVLWLAFLINVFLSCGPEGFSVQTQLASTQEITQI